MIAVTRTESDGEIKNVVVSRPGAKGKSSKGETSFSSNFLAWDLPFLSGRFNLIFCSVSWTANEGKCFGCSFNLSSELWGYCDYKVALSQKRNR